MKYIIELEKIEGTDLYRAKGANTLVFDGKGIKNILKPLPETEPEVDWSKVAVDTPILVKDSIEENVWCKRHFADYKNGKVQAWDNGRTSFTAGGIKSSWYYAKLVEVKE